MNRSELFPILVAVAPPPVHLLILADNHYVVETDGYVVSTPYLNGKSHFFEDFRGLGARALAKLAELRLADGS